MVINFIIIKEVVLIMDVEVMYFEIYYSILLDLKFLIEDILIRIEVDIM